MYSLLSFLFLFSEREAGVSVMEVQSKESIHCSLVLSPTQVRPKLNIPTEYLVSTCLAAANIFQLTVSCGSCNTLVKVSGPSCPDIIFTFQSKSYIFGVRYNEMWINPTYRNTPHHIFYLTHPPVTALTPAVE